MCAETAIKNNLALAVAVLIVGGGCLGWVGNKAVDYTFSDVRQNTEFRISAEVENEHTKQELSELKEIAIRGELERRMNHDLLIEIRAEMKGWERSDDK
jgi:hypothetical protein